MWHPGTMPGLGLLENDDPKAGFYGEDSVGVNGQYGTETGADTGTAPGGSWFNRGDTTISRGGEYMCYT